MVIFHCYVSLPEGTQQKPKHWVAGIDAWQPSIACVSSQECAGRLRESWKSGWEPTYATDIFAFTFAFTSRVELKDPEKRFSSGLFPPKTAINFWTFAGAAAAWQVKGQIASNQRPFLMKIGGILWHTIATCRDSTNISGLFFTNHSLNWNLEKSLVNDLSHIRLANPL